MQCYSLQTTQPVRENRSLCRSKDWTNPFLPYDEALWVGHLSESHTLLLNKFNLVEHHVLVVTRDFQSQDDPLNAADLHNTLRVVQVWTSMERVLHSEASGAVSAARYTVFSN